MDVMGPLCKLWESLEKASASINNLIKFVTQTIMLLEQTNIALSYDRRLSALDSVMKSTTQAKSMLKTSLSYSKKKIKIFLTKSFMSRYQRQ